jgi:hypothetical protein
MIEASVSDGRGGKRRTLQFTGSGGHMQPV